MDEQTESLVGELPSRPGGYRPDDVGALVGRLQGTLADAEAKAVALQSRLAELEAVRAAQRARESRLRDILLEAQHEARELQERGEAERDELLSSARSAALERREGLESERVGLRSSLGELEAFERTLRLRCRFLFEQALGEMPTETPGSSPIGDPLAANGSGPSVVAAFAPTPADPPFESEVTEEFEALPAEAASEQLPAVEGAPGGDLDGEPNTAESVVPVEPVDEALVTYEQPREPSATTTPALLTAEGEERIRILARPEPADDGPQASPAAGPSRWGRSLLVALAVIFALGAIAAALVVLLTGDETSTRSATVATVSTTGPATEATGAEAGGTAPTGEEPSTATASTQEQEEPPVTTQETAGEETTGQPPPAAPAPITLSMAATGGDCWLEVRRGSATGSILFQGFLLQGDSETFEGKKLWARMGQPGSLTIKVDGKTPKGLPEGTSDVIFTADGVEVVGLG